MPASRRSLIRHLDSGYVLLRVLYTRLQPWCMAPERDAGAVRRGARVVMSGAGALEAAPLNPKAHNRARLLGRGRGRRGRSLSQISTLCLCRRGGSSGPPSTCRSFSRRRSRGLETARRMPGRRRGRASSSSASVPPQRCFGSANRRARRGGLPPLQLLDRDAQRARIAALSKLAEDHSVASRATDPDHIRGCPLDLAVGPEDEPGGVRRRRCSEHSSNRPRCEQAATSRRMRVVT